MSYILFSAFKSEEDYKNNTPYFSKQFFDLQELKNFSAAHSKKQRKLYPNYCSDYKTCRLINIKNQDEN